jgi:hypothetical protein
MSTKHQRMQKFMRYYKEQTGEKELDMHKVAAFAEKNNWKMPKPKTPVELLAQEFSDAARVELKTDTATGKSYRVNHAYPIRQGKGSMTLWLWVDIDEAPRKTMLKCLINHREQMVGEAIQISRDTEHWNRIHPREEPIQIPLDFTDDVIWRENAPSEDEEEVV